jgi:hypothetical protein
MRTSASSASPSWAACWAVWHSADRVYDTGATGLVAKDDGDSVLELSNTRPTDPRRDQGGWPPPCAPDRQQPIPSVISGLAQSDSRGGRPLTSYESNFEHSAAPSVRSDIGTTGRQGRFAFEGGRRSCMRTLRCEARKRARRPPVRLIARRPCQNTHAPATQLPMSTCRHPSV